MAKAPGWMEMRLAYEQRAPMIYLRIRWWHPGAWWLFIRCTWKALMSKAKIHA